MVMTGKEESDKLEWKININGDATERLAPKSGLITRILMWFKGLIVEGFFLQIWRFLEKAWRIGAAEPKKVIHCLKVGMALSIVSLFYYMRPLYEGVGGTAMWAIMTVVVVFESTVGATFSKSVNRVTATLLAGSLGVGVHWLATQSGGVLEPFLIGISVFFLAFVATFSRFVPSVKSRFDYGAMIFILTFSLVSVSGYRVDKLIELARQRVITIAIGASICILVSTLFCPIWAGNELHRLVQRNLEKLADSLSECIVEYFKDNEALVVNEEDTNEKVHGYRCVLSSKATEESMANFARWEPAHGRFNFRHPWKQYLKIGVSMRSCAYCIENLNSCISSEIQAPHRVKKYLEEGCVRLSSASSKILRELAIVMKNMRKSSNIDFLVDEMNSAVRELQETLRSIPNQATLAPEDENRIILPPFLEVLPLATPVSLLIETASRIRGIVEGVDQLANLAEFELESKKKKKENQRTKKKVSDIRVEGSDQ